jgi:hypothetical protein
LTTAVWKVIGNTATGTSHTLIGRGCDDSFGWRVGPDLVAMAVADGAGSRPRSDIGSQAAVAGILDWAHTYVTGGGSPELVEGFEWVRAELQGLATRLGCGVDSLATTLGVVIVRPDVVEVGQIGDTIVVLKLDDGTLARPSPPETFEYVNETVFVTADSAISHLRIDRYPAGNVQGVALSTDGLRFKILSDLARSEPYGPFFDDIFSYASGDGSNSEAVGRFLAGLDDQSGDDKTLVIGIRRERAIGPSDPPLEQAVVGPERSFADVTSVNDEPV